METEEQYNERIARDEALRQYAQEDTCDHLSDDWVLDGKGNMVCRKCERNAERYKDAGAATCGRCGEYAANCWRCNACMTELGED